MDFKSLNCPRCGAVIEAEDGLDTFFCKYCGNKIMISGQSDAAYDAKVRIQENKLKYDNEKEKQKMEHDGKVIFWKVYLAFFALLCILITIILILDKI